MLEKILIIEDELLILEDLVSILSKDFEIYKASSLEEASKKIDSQSFSVILSDINLPDGLAINLIKKYATTKLQNTPIVFMTGSNERIYVKEAIRLGAFGFIDKPFKLDDISTIINKAIYYNSEMISSKLKKIIKLTIP